MAKKTDETNQTVETQTVDTDTQIHGGTVADATVSEGDGSVASDPTASKRPRRLDKTIDFDNGTVKISVIGGTKGEMIFALTDLPEEILKKLPLVGLNHTLGDAAAGSNGEEAEAAIEKKFDALKSGDWTTRAPAAPKLTKAVLADRLASLSPEEQAAAKAALAKLNLLF